MVSHLIGVSAFDSLSRQKDPVSGPPNGSDRGGPGVRPHFKGSNWVTPMGESLFNRSTASKPVGDPLFSRLTACKPVGAPLFTVQTASKRLGRPLFTVPNCVQAGGRTVFVRFRALGYGWSGDQAGSLTTILFCRHGIVQRTQGALPCRADTRIDILWR